MPLPVNLVIPADMGSNIREGSTVPGAKSTDVNHWVAAIFRETLGDFVYMKAAVGQDVGNATIAQSDAYEVTPNYVRLAIIAALSSLTDVHLASVAYNGTTRTITFTETNSATYQITLPTATSTMAGLVKMVQVAQQATAAGNDTDPVTGALVAAMIQTAINAIPAAFDTKVASFAFNSASRTLVITDNAGGTFNATIPQATNSVFGLIKLATAAMYPSAIGNDLLGTSPAYVDAAIAAAIAALPVDRFVQSMLSYDVTTNIMTLQLSDGSTVPLDFTQVIADAVASVADATGTVKGKVALATSAEGAQPTNDVDATTPKYVGDRIADAIAALPAGYVLPQATTTTLGGVTLATAAEAVAGTDTAKAMTAADVAAAIAAKGHVPYTLTNGTPGQLTITNTGAQADTISAETASGWNIVNSANLTKLVTGQALRDTLMSRFDFPIQISSSGFAGYFQTNGAGSYALYGVANGGGPGYGVIGMKTVNAGGSGGGVFAYLPPGSACSGVALNATVQANNPSAIAVGYFEKALGANSTGYTVAILNNDTVGGGLHVVNHGAATALQIDDYAPTDSLIIYHNNGAKATSSETNLSTGIYAFTCVDAATGGHGFLTNGTVFAAAGFLTSDKRLKSNIKAIDGATAAKFVSMLSWDTYTKVIDYTQSKAIFEQRRNEAKIAYEQENSKDAEAADEMPADEQGKAGKQARQKARQEKRAKMRELIAAEFKPAEKSFSESGVIAQEVQDICKKLEAFDFVVTADVNGMLSVNYTAMQAIINAGNQFMLLEQDKRMNSLEARLAKLEAK